MSKILHKHGGFILQSVTHKQILYVHDSPCEHTFMFLMITLICKFCLGRYTQDLFLQTWSHVHM